MAKTVIDIDEDLLALAAEVLGTKTKRETVEYALRKVAAPLAQDRLAESIANSGYTPAELDKMLEDAWH
jgi:Arc/MetJ family transcription regulator